MLVAPKAPTYDVGIVKFDTPISMPVYGELPPLGFLESNRGHAFLEFLASAVPGEPEWDRAVLGKRQG